MHRSARPVLTLVLSAGLTSVGCAASSGPMAKAPEVAVIVPTPQPLPAAPSVRHCEQGHLAECTAACEQHDAISCVFLGETIGSDVRKDYGRAAALFKEACEQGHRPRKRCSRSSPAAVLKDSSTKLPAFARV